VEVQECPDLVAKSRERRLVARSSCCSSLCSRGLTVVKFYAGKMPRR